MSCEINCKDNGPLIVSGEFELRDAGGNAFGLGGRKQIGLCRCGASANKPFCDGSHRGIEFACQPQARDLPPVGGK
jgi:CDGSH-type Zn-finger protein